MRNPIDTARGRIIDIDERRGKALIEVDYDDVYTFIKRGYKECIVQMIDSRPVSDKQRKTCYALLRSISKHTGHGIEPIKVVMKKWFLEEIGAPADTYFSLGDASMSMVCAFQKYLIRFVLDYDIPCSIPLLDFVDDVQDYLYACLVSKKCCICGKPCDLHHLDAVGAGRDREEIIHEGMEVLPLCRAHHNEAHNLGKLTFLARYHITKGVAMTVELCIIYNLKRKKEVEDAEPHYLDGPTDP